MTIWGPPMLNKSRGQMYPWVDGTRNFMRGECPHKCKYCYVRSSRVKKLYTGKPYLAESAFKPLGKGKTIFVGSMFDVFAEGIDPHWVDRVLVYCNKYPDNTYVFQTKNPKRAHLAIKFLPPKFMIGTTLETNRDYKDTSAPQPMYRYVGMLKFIGVKTFVSIEPIMDFDLNHFVDWLKCLKPDFVSIGADSKGHNLREPSPEKVKELIAGLKEFTEVKIKDNLKRILEER